MGTTLHCRRALRVSSCRQYHYKRPPQWNASVWNISWKVPIHIFPHEGDLLVLLLLMLLSFLYLDVVLVQTRRRRLNPQPTVLRYHSTNLHTSATVRWLGVLPVVLGKLARTKNSGLIVMALKNKLIPSACTTLHGIVLEGKNIRLLRSVEVVELFVFFFIVLKSDATPPRVHHMPLHCMERLKLLGIWVIPTGVQGHPATGQLQSQVGNQALRIFQVLSLWYEETKALVHVLQIGFHTGTHVIVKQAAAWVPWILRVLGDPSSWEISNGVIFGGCLPL
mmetsp:Transcript_29012/g.81727  ORF Transcript_29012/g.81727 Transcript_29012/m.81727 type:complete len:279 (-) Transcript_29012:666-1502(-)